MRRENLSVRAASVVTLFCLTLLFCSAPMEAQVANGTPYVLEQSVIAGGGGQKSSGGNFSLDGTIGQPAAGGPITNSPFEHYSGFWSFAALFGSNSADLSVTKTDLPDTSVAAGGNITYTLNFVNNSTTNTAANVRVSDILPTNTTFVSASVTGGAGWNMTDPGAGNTGTVIFSKALAAGGETAQFQIVVRVNPTTAAGTVISNTAEVASDTPDGNPNNNSGTAQTTVACNIASPSITANPPSVVANSTGNGASTSATNIVYAWSIVNGAITGATNASAITYTAGSSGSVTLNLTVTDASGCGTSNSLNVPITPAPAAPPVVTTSSGSANFTEGGSPVVVDPNITVSDPDSENLTRATVAVAANFTAGQDFLSFTAPAGFTGSYDAASGVLTIVGAASVAQYQAVLRSVTYDNISSDPNTAARSVNFTVTDGSADSNTASRGVTITASEATLTVTKSEDTNDGVCDADCSLREAITAAGSGDAIIFDIPGAGPHIIQLDSALPALSVSVNITNASGESVTVRGEGAADPYRIFTINSGRSVNISNLTITNGFADNGGGIRNDGALTLSGSTVSGNTSSGFGGGIFNNRGAPTSLKDNAVSGGITVDGTLTIQNSTVSGNSAADGGGGIFNDGGALDITSSTVTDNRADSDDNGTGAGGGVGINNSAPLLRNSIVADNYRGTAAEDDIDGTVDGSSSFNLIGTGGSGGLADGANDNQVGVANPGLAALADNGGHTKTHALQPGSPAIDKGGGFGATTDQRGAARPVDNPSIPNASGGDSADIGAVELQAGDFQPDLSVTMTVAPDPVPQFGTLTYTITITNGGSADAANVVLDQTDFTNFGSQPQLQVVSLTAAAGFTCRQTQGDLTTPFGGNSIRCQGATLGARQTAQFAFVKRLRAGLPANTVINHRATAAATAELTTVNNTANDSTTVVGNLPGRP